MNRHAIANMNRQDARTPRMQYPLQPGASASLPRARALASWRLGGSTSRSAARGFTILELLLVLVILAILAGIVASRFVGQSQSARVKAARTQLENLNLALNRFEIDLGRFPSSSEGLRVLIEKPGDGAKAWQGPYLDSDKIPVDQWENAWNYRQPGQHRSGGFDLWSNGPDGREGGGDDIANWSE